MDNDIGHTATTYAAGTRNWWRWLLVERMRAALDSIDAARTSDQIRRLRSAIETELVGDRGRALKRRMSAAARQIATRKYRAAYGALAVAALGLGLVAFSGDQTESLPVVSPAFPSLVLDGGLDSLRSTPAGESAGPGETTVSRRASPQFLAVSASDILDAVGLGDVQVAPGIAGTVKVSGYAGTAMRWANVRETLLADIPGLVGIDESGLETAGTRAATLAGELAERSLDDLAVRVNDGAIVVDGTLERGRLDAWAAVAKRFQQRYPNGPTLDDRVRRIVPPADMTIRGALIQRRQQLLLLEVDGLYQRYRVGDILPDGSTLTAIDKDFAVLTATSGQRMIYDLRSNLWRSM